MKTPQWVAVLLFSIGCGQAPQNAPGANATTSTPAPSESAAAPSAPAAPPPERVRLEIPSGTRLPIVLNTTVSTDSNRAGDEVLAELSESVPLKGFTLDKGAEVRGHITVAVPAKRVKGRARLVLAFDAVMEKGEKISIETNPVDMTAKSTSSKDKKIIGGGAVGGLIIGAITGGKKGAAIGTAAGAAAGGGAVVATKGHEVEIHRGATLTLVVK